MKQRAKSKPPRNVEAGRGRAAGPVADAVTRLEQERDELKAELEAARRRIAELETARAQVLDRIDWAIDSLHNVIESDTGQ